MDKDQKDQQAVKNQLDFTTCLSANITFMNKIAQFNLPSAGKMADQVMERLKSKESAELTDIELLMDACNNIGDMSKDLGMMVGNLTIMLANMINLFNQRLPGNIVPASIGDMKDVEGFLKGGSGGKR